MTDNIISGMTNEGLRLLALSQADENKKIIFSRFKIGEGFLSDENPAELTDLINSIGELDIDECKILKADDGSISLRVSSVIKQADQGYYFRELGLFAYDPDTNEEVLYAYVNKGDKASYIPAVSEKITTEEKASMVVAISNASNISVNYTSELKTDAIDAITSVLHKRNIGELIWSSLPLEDSTLLLANGLKLEKDGLYPAFVEYMNDLKSKNSTGSWYCTEEEWQGIVAKYGACGKYVVEEDFVRIPKLTGFIEGTVDTDALGDLVEAGLPNIEGWANFTDVTEKRSFNGCFHQTGKSAPAEGGGRSASRNYLAFDASRSNSIYGNSSTVQPQAIQQFIYIVISTDNTKGVDIAGDYDENGILAKMNDITNTFETTKASIRTNANSIVELTSLVNSYNDAIENANSTAEEISTQFNILRDFINNIETDIVKINGDSEYINITSSFETTVEVSSNNELLDIICSSVPTFEMVGKQIYEFTYTNKVDDELTSERWVDENGNDVDLSEEYSLEVVGTPQIDDMIILIYRTYRKFDVSYDDTVLQEKADKSELDDYYTKDETYTRTEINDKIDLATGVSVSGFYHKSEVDTLLNEKADKTELPTKVSAFENDKKYIVETTFESEVNNLNKAIDTKMSSSYARRRIPNGTIIQSCSAYMENSTCIECNGEKLNISGESENPKITLYPLAHVTGNGNNYLTELYTSNKYVCVNDVADIDDIYYYDRKTGKYRHIEEEISMSKGVITSVSGFFDGKHEVDLEHSFEVTLTDMWYREFDVPNKKIKDVLPDCYHNGESLSDNQLPNMTGYNCYSTAETDRTISCNGYMTNIIDGKANTVGTYDLETNTWSSFDLTDKISQDFWMEFDWITPTTFKAGNLFHGYRSLVLNIGATGSLTLYIAGYKSSNSLKWRVSGRNTGIVFEPNTKYKIAVKSWESLKRDMNTNLSTNPNPYIDTYSIKGYTITVAPYLKDFKNKDKLDYSNQQTDCVLTAYAPYNYYSSYGMRTLYHADAAVYAGGFTDLYTMKIWMSGCENIYPEITDLYDNQTNTNRTMFTPIYTTGTNTMPGVSLSQAVLWATGHDIVEYTGNGVGSVTTTWDGSETYFYDGDVKKLLNDKEISFDDEALNEALTNHPYSVNRVWTPLSKYSQKTKEIEEGFYAPYIPPKNGMKYYKIYG